MALYRVCCKLSASQVVFSTNRATHTLWTWIKDKCEEDRYRIRQEESKAVLDKMKQWLDKHSPGLIYGEALTFLPHR